MGQVWLETRDKCGKETELWCGVGIRVGRCDIWKKEEEKGVVFVESVKWDRCGANKRQVWKRRLRVVEWSRYEYRQV